MNLVFQVTRGYNRDTEKGSLVFTGRLRCEGRVLQLILPPLWNYATLGKLLNLSESFEKWEQ